MKKETLYQAILTKAGARRLNVPELAGKVVLYDGFTELGTTINNIWYPGEFLGLKMTKLGANLSFNDPDPGCELLTKPE